MPSDLRTTRPLLGIGIPTFNRASCLRNSLQAVLDQSSKCGDDVSVAVCDNASSDETLAVTRDAKIRWSQLSVRRNPVNIGGVANILRIVEIVDAEWVWVFPDDCLPSLGVVERLLVLLRDARPPFVYLRCSQWVNNREVTGRVKKSDILGSRGEICQHLSWLPCLLLHRDSILKYMPVAYRLSHFSYPHLVLALSALSAIDGDPEILVLDDAFKTQPEVNITKRYSWIHGALLQYANTVKSCLPAASSRMVLRLSARREGFGGQALRTVVSEYRIIPPATPWALLRFYGLRMLPMLLVYCWLRYVPIGITLFLFKTILCLFPREKFVGMRNSIERLHFRLSSKGTNLAANF